MSDLLYEVKDKIATITLNRPDKLNAFTGEMIDAWQRALAEAQRDDGVNVVIVTGAGRAFCSGGDVGRMRQGEPTALDGKNGLWEGVHRVPKQLEQMDKPVIAMVNGLAVGAGMGLSMLTLLIAVQSAVPRDQLGIATSSTQFFRSIGGIVGVAVMGSVLSSHLSAEVERVVQTGGNHQELAELARHPDVIINAAARARIPASTLHDFTTALDHALHSVFLVALVVSILAFFSAFLVPRGKSQTSVSH